MPAYARDIFVPLAAKNDSIWIDNGVLGLTFQTTTTGCSLRNLVSIQGGASFAVFPPNRPGAPTIWELEFRNAAGDVVRPTNEDAGTFRFERPDSNTLLLVWDSIDLTFRNGDGTAVADVTVEIHLPDGDQRAYWDLSITLSDADVTLWQIAFPTFGDLRRVGADRTKDHLTLPNGWGASIPNPIEADDLASYENMYPSGFEWTMQFLALDNEDAGVYLAFHDPEGTPKRMRVEADQTSDTLSFRTIHIPPDRGTCQERVELPYPFVTGSFAGDWYDAAQLYREWAHSEATWMKAGPVVDRTDIPDWFKDVSLWWQHHGADPEPLGRLKDRFQSPTGVHWYNWHQIPFDTDYPDFFPPRDGWEAAVTELQDDRFHVMPYINARIADPNSRIWSDRKLDTAAAKRASARFKPATTTRYVETYGRGRQLLSPMCATTGVWRETIRELVTQLGTDVGVDAVYLDQIAAGCPPMCHDTDHDHPPGGGAYAVAAYQDLLNELVTWKSTNAPEFAMTTECNAEPYMGGVAGYLMWHSARSDQVPLFPAVYGDYCMTFGCQFFEDDLDNDGDVFASKIGHLFTNGAQLGWMGTDLGEKLLDDEVADLASYLDITAAAFQAGWPYLPAGRRLRDPEPRSPIPTASLTWNMRNHGYWEVDLPVVMTGLWSAPANRGVALAVTNWTTDTHAGVWRIAQQHLPADGTRAQDMVTGEPVELPAPTKDGQDVELVLAPRSTIAIKIGPEAEDAPAD